MTDRPVPADPPSPLTRVVLNTETGEFFEAEYAVLVESEMPLNLDFIRESGQDIRSFGDVATLDAARAPDAELREALTHAISVLENYGDHHGWCARGDGSAEPCSCGLWGELERLGAALTSSPAPAGLDVEHCEACTGWATYYTDPPRPCPGRAATRPAEDEEMK